MFVILSSVSFFFFAIAADMRTSKDLLFHATLSSLASCREMSTVQRTSGYNYQDYVPVEGITCPICDVACTSLQTLNLVNSSLITLQLLSNRKLINTVTSTWTKHTLKKIQRERCYRGSAMRKRKCRRRWHRMRDPPRAAAAAAAALLNDR